MRREGVNLTVQFIDPEEMTDEDADPLLSLEDFLENCIGELSIDGKLKLLFVPLVSA
jgi:hypothetical protein